MSVGGTETFLYLWVTPAGYTSTFTRPGAALVSLTAKFIKMTWLTGVPNPPVTNIQERIRTPGNNFQNCKILALQLSKGTIFLHIPQIREAPYQGTRGWILFPITHVVDTGGLVTLDRGSGWEAAEKCRRWTAFSTTLALVASFWHPRAFEWKWHC